MLKRDHDYTLLLCTEDGTVLSHSVVDVDWQPAIEWARLAALREAAPSLEPAGGEAGIEPEWSSEVGEPYISGFCVTDPQGARCVSFSNGYFAKYVRAGSAGLVEQGKLRAGDLFRYLILALPRQEQVLEPARIRFRSSEPTAIEISPASLAEFLAHATPSGTHQACDPPVFLPRQVLDEVTAIYRRNTDAETGGVFVGGLRRDDADGQIFLEVTAQIPALHTNADATRLTFTAETWRAVRAALALRRRGEIWVGWWHTHPVRSWTRAGEEQSPAGGEAGSVWGGFFSEPLRFLRSLRLGIHK